MTNTEASSKTVEKKKARRPHRLYKPAVTVGMIVSGTVLVTTGLTLFPAHYGFSGIWKLWGAIGVSKKAINVGHQIGAIGFLTAAGFHVYNNNRTIKRHAQTLVEASQGSKDVKAQPVVATA